LPGAVRGWRAVIVSRRWLEALLGRPLDAREVAEQLTMHVAAVDAVVPLHQDLGDVLIGRVLEVKKHPNADRLSLCRVDAGGAELGGTVKLPPIFGAGSAATAAEGGVPAGRSRASRARGGEAARAGGRAGLGGPRGPATSGTVDGVEVRLEDAEGAPRYMIAV